jgi:hypothetical protein
MSISTTPEGEGMRLEAEEKCFAAGICIEKHGWGENN